MGQTLLVNIDLEKGADILRILGPLEAHGLTNDALRAAGFRVENKPPVLILPMADPFIRALRRSFGNARSVEGMRLGGQPIGNRWVEDGYVYRIFVT